MPNLETMERFSQYSVEQLLFSLQDKWMTFSNKKLHKHEVIFFVCQKPDTQFFKKNLPPCSPVAVQFLVDLRLLVADGPQKCNSNCLQVLLAFSFSDSDSQV